MKSNIPNIAFKGKQGATDIELISLNELFLRVGENPDHDPRQPHRIEFFALLIVTSGSGTHQVDLQNYDITAGDVLKIAKGQVHAFQENFEYEGFLVAFTEDFLVKQFSKSSVDFISHLYNYHLSKTPVQKSSYTLPFLKEAQFELKLTNDYAKKEILAKIVELYLLRLERQAQIDSPVDVNVKHQTLFLNFKNLVEKKYTETRNVKTYAEELAISPKYLNEIVQKVTLNTAKNFIDNYVILEIKRVIFAKALSLKEITYLVGFDEVTNFTKFFKKHTGYTPKEFKSSL